MEKLLKKPLIFSLVTVMLFTVFLTGCKTDRCYDYLNNENCHKNLNRGENYFDNLQSSKSAYDEAIKCYKTNGVYNDEYGGSYIDKSGYYTICATTLNRPFKSENLKYNKVRHSYGYLNEVQKEITSLVNDLAIWSSSVCYQCNRVVVFLEDKQEIEIIVKHLKDKNLAKRDVLYVYVGKALEIII